MWEYFKNLIFTKDNSLEDFLSELENCIVNDNIENSFQTFHYYRIKKNKIYKAIENYKKNGTIFYTNILSNNPGLIIKHINVICLYEIYEPIGENIKGVAPTGTYCLKFDVFYEK